MSSNTQHRMCCVPGCHDSDISHRVLHCFPNPEKERKRFEAWRESIGGPILHLPIEHVYKYRRVCHAHFDERFHCSFNRISIRAIPSLMLEDSNVQTNEQIKRRAASEDIQKKHHLVKHVIDECKRLCLVSTPEDVDQYTRFKNFTGVDASKCNFHEAVSLESAYNETQLRVLNRVEINSPESKAIHGYVYTSYLRNRKIPTINEITDHMSKQHNINTDKKWPGFIWKQLPGMKKGIFMELPELIAKRILYLKKMFSFREENRHIIHVETIKIEEDKIPIENQNIIFFIAASSQNGIIREDSYYDSKTKNLCFIDLMNCIDKECVLVLEEPYNDTPTINSTKSVMRIWLEKNNIPYDPENHRCEFYNLIEKAKHQIKSDLENLIRSFGYEFVFHPQDMLELNYLAPFWKKVKESREKLKGLSFIDHINFAKKSISLDEWQKWDKKLEIIEQNTYADDLLMEEVIDQLMMMAAQGNMSEDTEGLTPDPGYWTDALSDIVI